MPWAVFFADTALKALIGDALRHNNDLQAAVKNIDAAELTQRQARLGNVPSVGLGASASDARPSDNSFDHRGVVEAIQQTHLTDYTVAASLSWEADIWGKIRNQKAAALAAYLATDEARKALQTRIINDLSKGYYNLLLLDAQLAIAQRNIALADSTLTLVKLQYSSGNGTSLAVQQALAQKLTAAALAPKIQQEAALQETAIGILCGRYSSAVGRDVPLNSVSLPDGLGVGIPTGLLSRRPEVRQAEFELSKANAEVGYTRAAMYPSLTISAEGGLDAFKASNWFNIPASLFGAVAGGVAQPLFDKKRLSTQWNIAKANRERSVLAFRQSVLVAYGEVADALAELDKLKDEQGLVAGRTDALVLATQNSRALYTNGKATYLDVIVAENSLLASELELAAVKKSRLDASVDLYRSLGGGWQ